MIIEINQAKYNTEDPDDQIILAQMYAEMRGGEFGYIPQKHEDHNRSMNLIEDNIDAYMLNSFVDIWHEENGIP